MRHIGREAWASTPSQRVSLIALAAGVVGIVVAIALIAMGGEAVNAPWHVGSTIALGAATVVARRRPDHPLAPWFSLMTATVLLGYVMQDLLRWSIDQGWSSSRVFVVGFALHAVVSLSVVSASRIFTRFRDGFARDAVERRSVHVIDAGQLVALVAFFLCEQILWPSFISGEPLENPVRPAGFSLEVGTARGLVDLSQTTVLIAFIVLLRRYRRSDAVERRQMRWLLLPLVAALFALFAELLFLRGSGHAGALAGLVVSVALALGIAFGIMRPEGIDSDLVLRRSLVWGAVWVVIALAYVGIAAALGVTVGNRFSAGWAITMTVMTMLALQPVRSRLELVASRRLFGPPPDPQRALARLGESLAATQDLDAVLPQIERALVEALGVEWVHVRVSADGRGPASDASLSVPILLEDDEVGIIECGPRPSGPLTEDDTAIVSTLAGQAAMAVRNVRLATQLRERSAELRASRSRLVRAEEEERRRIERNIHDGAQQQLVALIGQTGIVRSRLRAPGTVAPDRLASLEGEVEDLQEGLRRLLAELRELAAGIHPSVLRDQGLLPAVEALAARHPIPVEVRADIGLRSRRLPVEIEAAGYYTVAEALANSLKHASASSVDIELDGIDDGISIRVADDGVGFSSAFTNGRGIANLSERVAAVEGRLAIDAEPGVGTVVHATIPAPTDPGEAAR